VPAVAGGITVGKNEGVLLELTLNPREVKIVLHHDVRQSGRVTVGTWSVLNVTDRVRHVSIGFGCVVILTVPAVREMNCAIEVWVVGTRSDSVWEASAIALVPGRRLVTDPLCDVIFVSRGVLARSPEEHVSSDHAEAFWKLKRSSHGTSTRVPVVIVSVIVGIRMNVRLTRSRSGDHW